MGRLRLKVHPLFFVFGIYYAVTGKLFMFLIYTLTALIHESGHSLCAERLGYRLKSITLMPYGAVINGNIDGINLKDETKVAISGPLVNVLVATVFVALWWVYPNVYAYTDTVVTANLSLAFINVFPAYPLDGGRVLLCALKKRLKERTAERVIKGVGLFFATAMIALFIVSCFNAINVSLLFFAVFMLTGVFSKNKRDNYVKLFSSFSPQSLKRGMCVKRQAVSQDITIKKLINLLDASCLNEVDVYKSEKKIKTLSQKEISALIEKSSIYDTLNKALRLES